MRRMREGDSETEWLRAGLTRHFGLTDFRPGQAEVMSAVLSGRNAVVVMPTGAGKSLCYQLPATLLSGTTIVFSPLIALMKDQVDQLLARNIAATYINSTLSDFERADRLHKLRNGRYKLVYVAPERFRSRAFIEALSSTQVSLLAVDEAHCISQWGHDFRPDYALLGQIRKRIRPPRTVALTATASPEVRDDIVRSLLMKDPQVFVAGFDRKNLFLEVVQVRGDEDRARHCVALTAQGGSGIVYCSTRKAAESLHHLLKQNRRNSILYHAGMDEAERERAQDAFMKTPDAVAVATNAFGMGIDKPDIRFVVHAQIPKAMEAYYQEVGRAGRDGKPAHAVLLFNHADVFTQERLLQGSYPSETIIADVWNLICQTDDEFAGGVSAIAARTGATEFEVTASLKILEREGKLVRSHRGEGNYQLMLAPSRPTEQRHTGDNAQLLKAIQATYSPGPRITTTLALLSQHSGLTEDKVRRALSALGRVGALHVRRPFTGRTVRAVEKVPFRDLALDLSRVREQEQRALAMLKRMTDYAYAKRCRRAFLLRYFGEIQEQRNCDACDVCAGARVQPLPAHASDGRAPAAPNGSFALESLRRWRRELSKDLSIPAFIIFNDATLEGLASTLPLDRESFLSVRGTGESRWERFGAKVVEISQLARAAGVESQPIVSAKPERRRAKAPR